MRDEGGYSLVELVVAMAILGVVVGSIVILFVSALTSDADQSRRFQAQQDVRIALDRMRRDTHSACAVANPATYNLSESSITLYYSSDSCAAGAHSISWCASALGSRYALYREAATSCASVSHKYADYLTSSAVFTYLPPNSHVTTLGGGAGGIATQDGSSTLPRLHIDLRVNRKPAKSTDVFRVVDDIALRNAPRSCATGVASC